MADRKISDLTALTTPASGDYLPIVDISEAAAASKNKRITIEELMRGVPDGTAAAPGSAFETDPNSGIYSPGADQLAVATNGTGRLFIGANPHVGIGVTPNASSASSQVLEVGPSTFSSIGNDSYQGANWFYTGAAYVYKNSAAATQYVQASGNHIWLTAATGTAGNAATFSEKMRITDAGLVGIGTSNPFSVLHCVGAAEAEGDAVGQVIIRSTNAYNATPKSGIIFQILQDSSSNTAYVASIHAVKETTGDADRRTALVFGTRAISGTTAERLRITSAGLVGIGTTSPGDILHLKSANPIVIIEATGTYGGITLSNSGGAANTSYLLNTNAGVLTFRSNAITFNSYDGVTERIRIDTSGRLLVGTSSNSGGALFQVNGDRIRVGTAKTPATSGATGTTGEIAWDANYIYVCTATDTWKRTAIATG